MDWIAILDFGSQYTHLIAKYLGGEVKPARKREYGKATIEIKLPTGIFEKLGEEETVWMSHGDLISKLPGGFKIIGRTENSPYAAFCDRKGQIFGVQFHPEVTHTPKGKTIIRNFLFKVARCKPSWNMHSFVGRFYFSAQIFCNKLSSITDTQDWNT